MKETTSENNNINTNNINVNVNMDKPKPKTTRKRTPKKEDKPNWIVKAVIIALIGLAVTFGWNSLMEFLNRGNAKSPVIITNPN